MAEILAPGTLLGQVRGTIANQTLLTAPVGLSTVITSLAICNTSGAATTCRVFHHNTGTTFDETTAILFDNPLGDGETLFLESGLKEDGLSIKGGGAIGVQCSVTLSVTFSAYGVTQKAR